MDLKELVDHRESLESQERLDNLDPLETGYVHMHTCTHVRTHAYTCTYTCIHMYVHIHTHVRTYTYTCTYIYIHMYVHIHTHVRTYTYTCTYIYIHMYTNAQSCVLCTHNSGHHKYYCNVLICRDPLAPLELMEEQVDQEDR